MGGSASETRVLSRATAGLARLVTGPTHAALVGEAPRWAAADAGAVKADGEEIVSATKLKCHRALSLLVQSIMLAGDTLCRSTSVASLLITFWVAVVQYHQLVVGISHHVFTLRCRDVVTVERRVSLLDIRASAAEEILIVGEALEVVAEVIGADRGLGEVGLRRRDVRIRGVCRTTAAAVSLEVDWVDLSTVEDELPFGEHTSLVHSTLSTVNDLQRPTSLSLFAPEVHTHERPIVEVRLDNVAWPLEQQSAGGARRRR